MSINSLSARCHRLELTGQQFGRWTVEKRAGVNERGEVLWTCHCSCGTLRNVLGKSLRSGKSKSCGCLWRESDTWTLEKDRASKKKYRDSQPGYRSRESKRWRIANPERARLYKRQTRYRIAYGMEIEDVERMFEGQGRMCAICKKDLVLGGITGGKVDHCHMTGTVRGILCSTCNTGLGCFKDSIKNLTNAIEYLKVHQ